MTFGRHVLVFPGKATKPGFSLSVGLWPCTVDQFEGAGGFNSVVKMRVYFGSPLKKQAIYGGPASAPSKKRVKMQSQLMPARVFV